MNTYSQVFLISFGLLISGTTHSAMAMGDFLFRNSSYASNLTIQAFVVTKDQICSLIEDMNDSPAGFRSKSHDELSKVVNTYLFIRIKNEANQAAWGTLSCRINHRDGYEVNIKLVHGTSWGHYGNLGGPKHMAYSFVPPEFEPALGRLCTLQFGQMEEYRALQRGA